MGLDFLLTAPNLARRPLAVSFDLRPGLLRVEKRKRNANNMGKIHGTRAHFQRVAGVWVTGTAFVNRQTDLVEAFADEMTYHIGDEKEMELCIKEYKGKLGPAMYREAMFKVSYVR